MKKLVLLSVGVFLVACSNNANETKPKTETVTTTTTTAPVVKEVEATYEIDMAGKMGVFKLKGKNNVLTTATITFKQAVKDVDVKKLSDKEKQAIVKVMNDSMAVYHEGFAKARELEGVISESSVIDGGVQAVVGMDFEKLDNLKFTEVSGENPYVFLFGEAAKIYKKSMPFDTAEALLEASGGRKVENK